MRAFVYLKGRKIRKNCLIFPLEMEFQIQYLGPHYPIRNVVRDRICTPTFTYQAPGSCRRFLGIKVFFRRLDSQLYFLFYFIRAIYRSGRSRSRKWDFSCVSLTFQNENKSFGVQEETESVRRGLLFPLFNLF